MANKTFLNNHFSDFNIKAAETLLTKSLENVSNAVEDRMKEKSEIYLHIIQTKEADVFCDGTVYTGSAGYALFYTMRGINTEDGNKELFMKALNYINIKKLKCRRISFLCGDAGPLALATVVAYKLGTERPDDIPDYRDTAQRLMHLSSLLNDSPDELLYGRVGYLYALLFVNKYTDDNTIPANNIEKVIDLILRSGKQLSSKMKSKSPLMWQWHNKVYYGGAHGIAGILYILLQAVEYINVMELRNFIKPTLDWLLGQQYPSGNFPSSKGSSSGDRLVQWCHGAPGFTPLCILAHKIFKEEKYLEIALKCGEAVWDRGLCSKGYSICHGVAGNAYTFIQLYQCTKDPKHLYRACCFAEWCAEERPGTELQPPDRPASLFEGILGRIFLFQDIQCIMKAKFPAFTL